MKKKSCLNCHWFTEWITVFKLKKERISGTENK